MSRFLRRLVGVEEGIIDASADDAMRLDPQRMRYRDHASEFSVSRTMRSDQGAVAHHKNAEEEPSLLRDASWLFRDLASSSSSSTKSGSDDEDEHTKLGSWKEPSSTYDFSQDMTRKGKGRLPLDQKDKSKSSEKSSVLEGHDSVEGVSSSRPTGNGSHGTPLFPQSSNHREERSQRPPTVREAPETRGTLRSGKTHRAPPPKFVPMEQDSTMLSGTHAPSSSSGTQAPPSSSPTLVGIRPSHPDHHRAHEGKAPREDASRFSRRGKGGDGKLDEQQVASKADTIDEREVYRSADFSMMDLGVMTFIYHHPFYFLLYILLLLLSSSFLFFSHFSSPLYGFMIMVRND